MATTATTDVSYISKVIYPDGVSQKQIVRDKPLLMNTPHDTNFTSAEGIKVPIIYATGQGASATVANAASNASPDLGKAFVVTQASYYTNFDISGQVVRNALKGDNDSYFLQQLKLAMDNAQETMGLELHRQAYGSANGVRGVVGSLSGGVITLSNVQDAVYFEPGMVIVASASAGGALRIGSGSVTNVDTAAGTVTYSGTITSITAADSLYRQGDAAAGGSNKLMSGLADWVPATVTSTAFFGVDRTAYPSRLAGVRYDGTNDSIETVFIKAEAQAKAQVGPGFVSGDYYINPSNFASLQLSKEGARWITEDGPYGLPIEKFQVGNFKFVVDAFCPVGVSYKIQQGAYKRASCGDAPFWNNFDGSDMWLDRTTDTYKGQLVHDGNMIGAMVQRMMRVALPTGA